MFLRIQIAKLAAAPSSAPLMKPPPERALTQACMCTRKISFILMLNTGILVNHVTAVTHRVHLIFVDYLMPLNKTFPPKSLALKNSLHARCESQYLVGFLQKKHCFKPHLAFHLKLMLL